jgi:hypothetical protein
LKLAPLLCWRSWPLEVAPPLVLVKLAGATDKGLNDPPINAALGVQTVYRVASGT